MQRRFPRDAFGQYNLMRQSLVTAIQGLMTVMEVVA
jgi:hypothetical protein